MEEISPGSIGENNYLLIQHIGLDLSICSWGTIFLEKSSDSVNPWVSAHYHPYYMVEKTSHVTFGIFLYLQPHNLRANTTMWPPRMNISYTEAGFLRLMLGGKGARSVLRMCETTMLSPCTEFGSGLFGKL